MSSNSIWALRLAARLGCNVQRWWLRPPRVLRGGPNVVEVVPLTRAIRDSGSEIVVEPDQANGLADGRPPNASMCGRYRQFRIIARTGNVGPEIFGELRRTLAI